MLEKKMLDVLKFVQGSVASKDFVPELMHFKIENGTIRGYNGMLGLCCPIALDLNVSPKAVPFIKAIQTCKDTVQLHVTPAGKLAVKSGKFKAFIDCIEAEFPDRPPEGVTTALSGSLLRVLKTLAPFIAEDASRPWARGILLRGQSAFATNNICVIEHWLDQVFPVEVNLPRSAVLELIRIGVEPISIQATDQSVTFHYPEGRWLRTQTYSTKWPDLERILNVGCNRLPIPAGLFEAITDLSPFVDDLGRIFLKRDGSISTGQHEGVGASVELPEMISEGCYHFKQILLLEKVATSIDLNAYPAPCLFMGDKVRGAIVGMRV
jgi:DNA polymerase III sliding clamp (beta) subunit (PCNA family)